MQHKLKVEQHLVLVPWICIHLPTKNLLHSYTWLSILTQPSYFTQWSSMTYEACTTLRNYFINLLLLYTHTCIHSVFLLLLYTHTCIHLVLYTQTCIHLFFLLLLYTLTCIHLVLYTPTCIHLVLYTQTCIHFIYPAAQPSFIIAPRHPTLLSVPRGCRSRVPRSPLGVWSPRRRSVWLPLRSTPSGVCWSPRLGAGSTIAGTDWIRKKREMD